MSVIEKVNNSNSDEKSNQSGSYEKLNPVTYARKKIFIRHVWGIFQKRRWIIFSFFLTLFYAIPWVRLNGKPMVLFDLPERKFHILNITLWPQEVYLLTLTLITAAIGLFFSTAIVGRVWCGYLCPQTVFSSVFIEIERMIMGDLPKQLKYNKKPMKGEKLARLTLRNFIWGAISLSAGFTFLSYFIPNTEIIHRLSTGELSGWPFFWLALISGFLFFDAGFFREQFCFVPCPYGRFQGALQDPNSLVVTYDKVKGEGNKAAGQIPACINCNLCVQVCPTGIDIRHGAQFECISCARCIDVCAKVQITKGRTPDLIRYESENGLNGKETKIIRPRVLIYSLIITLLLSFIGYKILFRPGFDFEVTRDRNLIYQELPGGKISNMYRLKLLNMSNEEQQYLISLKDFNGQLLAGNNPVTVPAGEVLDTSVSVIINQGSLPEKITPFAFQLERVYPENKKIVIEERSTFAIP